MNYQYKFEPVTTANLIKNVAPDAVLVTMQEILIVVSCPEENKPDMDAYMNDRGFVYLGEV